MRGRAALSACLRPLGRSDDRASLKPIVRHCATPRPSALQTATFSGKGRRINAKRYSDQRPCADSSRNCSTNRFVNSLISHRNPERPASFSRHRKNRLHNGCTSSRGRRLAPGHPRAAGVIVTGRGTLSHGPAVQTGSSLHHGLLPGPAREGIVLPFERKEPGALAGPARPGFVPKGSKGRTRPSGPVLGQPAPERLETRSRRSTARCAENSYRLP